MKKTLNLRYLLRFTIVVAVIGLGVHLLHARQTNNQAQAFQQRAEEAQKKGDLNRAVVYLSRYLVLVPDDTAVRAKMGLVMARVARKPDEKFQAFLVLEQVLREDPKREDVRRRNARLAMEPSLQLYAEALGHFMILKEAHPKDWELLDLIGQCQVALGNFAGADSEFTKAIELWPTSLSTYARRAAILRRQLNDQEQADIVIAALISANPDTAAAHLIAANYWREFGSLEKAELAVVRALELAPENAEVLLTAADFALARAEALRLKFQAELSKQEVDRARQFLQTAIDKNPPVPPAEPSQTEEEQDEIASKRSITAELYRSLVALEVRAGRLSEAEKLVRRGVEILPEQPELTLSLADVLIYRRQFDEADELLNKLQSVGYTPAILDYHRARIFAMQDRWLKASLVLARAAPELVLYPAFARQAYFLLGECYDQMGEIDLRYEAYDRSRPSDIFDPLWAPSCMAVAASQAEMGRIKEAIETYSSVARFYAGAAVPLARLLFVETVRQPRDKWDWRPVEEVLKTAPDDLDAVLLRVDVLQARGLTAEAVQALEKAKEKHADDVKFWLALAFQEFIQKDESKAQALLKDAEAKFGDHVEIRLTRSRFLSAPLTPESEMQLTRLAAGIDRLPAVDRRRLLRGLSDRAQELGAKDLASRLWDQLSIEQPDNLGVHYRRFDRALQADDEPAMTRVYEDIRRIDGSGGTSTRMARSLFLIWKARHGDIGGLNEARDHLLDLAQKRPDWPRIPSALALVYELKSDIDSAIPQYRRALDLGERDPEAVKRLIELYYQRQNFTEAEAILRNAPEAIANMEGMPFMAAEIYLESRNYARALEMAEKAVSGDVKDYRKHLWLGRVRWLGGKRAEAEASFRKAIELDGSLPEPWITLIQYLADMNRTQEAEKIFEEARKRIKPEETALTLAEGYEILGHVDEARQWYDKALGERPHHIGVLRNVASFRLRQARTENDLEPVRDLLERILRAQNKTREDTDSARRMLAIVLSLSPDYQASRRALEILGLLDESLRSPSVTDSVDELRTRAIVLSLQPGRRSKQEAVKLFEAIQNRRPLSPDDEFLLAQICNNLGDRDKAQRLLAHVVTARADNPLYVAFYTRFLILNGNSTAEARKWLTLLEKMQPDEMRTAELRARLLVAENQKNLAVDGVLAFVKAHKEVAIPAARVLESLNEFVPAELLYRQAAAESNQPANRLLLAGFYGRQNRNKDALDLLEHDAKDYPPQILVQTALGVLYTLDQPSTEDIGKVRAILERSKPEGIDLLMDEAALLNLQARYAEAAAAYYRVLERDPKNILAMNNLAFLIAFDQKKHAEALELIRKARSQSKPKSELMDTEAVIQIAAGNPEPAIELLEDATTDGPTAIGYFHLAQAYFLSGKKIDAAEAMSRAKKIGLRRSDLHPLERANYEELLKEFP